MREVVRWNWKTKSTIDEKRSCNYQEIGHERLGHWVKNGFCLSRYLIIWHSDLARKQGNPMLLSYVWLHVLSLDFSFRKRHLCSLVLKGINMVDTLPCKVFFIFLVTGMIHFNCRTMKRVEENPVWKFEVALYRLVEWWSFTAITFF